MHIIWLSKAKKNFRKLEDQYPQNAEQWHYHIIDGFVEETAEKIPDEVKERGSATIV